MPRTTVSVLLAIWLGRASVAQSVNIDFGGEAGTPPASYAAAGLPGVWNVIHHPWTDPDPPAIFGPYALVNLQGQATAATLTAQGTLGTYQAPPAGPLGHDAMLMDDGLVGHSPDISQHVAIEGLQNGLYRVITYTWWWPAELFGMVVHIEGAGIVQPVGGPWPGQLQVPTTHMVHVVQVADGMIQLEIVGAGPGSFFNGGNIIQGIQLWKIDEPLPCAADVPVNGPGSGDGVVNVSDLLAVIGSWGSSGGPADVTHDGIVDVSDLLLVVGSWGPCPGITPVDCGAAGLDDCYVAHAAPGCDEPACCEAVCGSDPFCCEREWDVLCVEMANLAANCQNAVHGNCGNPESGSCFEASDSLPGCGDSECCGEVCAIDPFCCNYGWDSACVEQAQNICAP